jgi:hypothetical protein
VDTPAHLPAQRRGRQGAQDRPPWFRASAFLPEESVILHCKDIFGSQLSSEILGLPHSERLVLYFTAAILLAVAPGPGMLYVLARSLAGGKREGVLSASGTFVGGLVHVLAAGLGLSVILARSALAFTAVKYSGAVYLCYLGVRMMLEPTCDDPVGVMTSPARSSFL